MTLTTSLGSLGVVGETGTGVIEGVDEEERSGTSSLLKISTLSFRSESREAYTTRCQVTHHPLGVSITLLLEREHGLVGVTESKVQRLGREVSDDVGGVTTPQRNNTLVLDGSREAVTDTVELSVQTARLQHLILERGLVCVTLSHAFLEASDLKMPMQIISIVDVCM